jgi:predicted dehydrogenase
MTKPIQAILIGAGARGLDAYAPYALEQPGQLQFVAVAEPDPERRARFAELHQIPAENQFESWEPLLEKPQYGQAALICTQDQMHTAPTLAALKAGYDILLEKPMAPTAEECRLLADTAEELGRQLHICHVLRYTEHFQQLKNGIDSGILGDIINFSHRENVTWWHMSHSFVRGNWRNTTESAPMILAKCCHDLDILIWLLGDRPEVLSSVGGLNHYRSENAPEGATKRCLDGCAAADSCRYYAPFIYIDNIPLWRDMATSSTGFDRWATQNYLQNPQLIKTLAAFKPDLKQLTDYRGWPGSTITNDATPENVMAALQAGPYGRCVYHCDNDVVDHQVVSMQFEAGTSVTLTMHGHSHLEGRTTRIEGTKATLLAQFGLGGSWVEIHEHFTDQTTKIDTSAKNGSGHGGGDERLMAAFVKALQENDESTALTTARTSLESHLMAFAAEEARLEQKVVQMKEYR